MEKRLSAASGIVAEFPESYAMKNGVLANGMSEQEKVYVMTNWRDDLYSRIVEKVPYLARFIFSSDIDENDDAKGVLFALTKHCVDPVFVSALMQRLAVSNIGSDNVVVGALLTKIMSRLIDERKAVSTTAKEVEVKKDDKDKDVKDKSKKAPAPAETAPDISDLGHIQEAITSLLDNIANMVTMKCGNLSSVESLCVAACLAMNNMMTIKELVASDLPITAQILDIVPDSSNLLSAALNIDKTYFNKLSTNQAAFIESLKRWVYEKLNRLDTNQIRAFLTASYGTASPDVSTKLIQVKDCGTAYGNLLFTAKIMFNK